MKLRNDDLVKNFILVVFFGIILNFPVAFAAANIGSNITTDGTIKINIGGLFTYTPGAGTGLVLKSNAAGDAIWAAESDPVYSASTASGITAGNILNWNNAFAWGNHALAGYLTSFTETDPVYGASSWATTANNSGNWDTAYTWGNHALAGYITASSANNLTNKTGNISQWTNDSGYLTTYSETDPVWTAASGNYLLKAGGTMTGDLNMGTKNITNAGTITGTFSGALTGNVTGNVSGKAANVTGTVAIGNGGTGQTTANNAFNALAPSQGGNNGKFLTTDGTNTSWAAASGGISLLNGLSGATQTFGNDTNVTISSAGTTHTLDWSGLLSIPRGGTNSNATPTKGGIAYGDGSAYKFSAAGTLGDCLKSGGAGAPTWSGCASGFVNTALSNLASVAINTSLLPGTTNSINLGSDTKNWSNIYLGNGGIIFEGATNDANETTLSVTDPTADRTVTIPNKTGTVQLESYGELYKNTPAGTSITISGFTQWITSTVGDTSGAGYVIGSAATDNLTIGANGAGRYEVSFNVSEDSATNNALVTAAVFVNGGQQSDLTSSSHNGTDTDIRNLSSGGILNLAAGDVIDVRFSTSAGNITVYNVNLMIHRIGI